MLLVTVNTLRQILARSVNNVLEEIRKEIVVAQFKALSQNVSEGTEK
jgi:hypothetical protein